MRKPASVGAWLKWSVYVLEAHARPFSPRYDRGPRTDPRLRDSRETALSVKILAERASAACTRNGVGYKLLVSYYVGDAAWSSFTEREQRTIKKTARRFARALGDAGFLTGSDL